MKIFDKLNRSAMELIAFIKKSNQRPCVNEYAFHEVSLSVVFCR